jgi:hypothetical protein
LENKIAQLNGREVRMLSTRRVRIVDEFLVPNHVERDLHEFAYALVFYASRRTPALAVECGDSEEEGT